MPRNTTRSTYHGVKNTIFDSAMRAEFKLQLQVTFGLSDEIMRNFTAGDILRNLREQAGLSWAKLEKSISHNSVVISALQIHEIEQSSDNDDSLDTRSIVIRRNAPEKLIATLLRFLTDGVDQSSFVAYNQASSTSDAEMTAAGDYMVEGKGLTISFEKQAGNSYMVTVSGGPETEPNIFEIRFSGDLEIIRAAFLEKCSRLSASSLPPRVGMNMIRAISDDLAPRR